MKSRLVKIVSNELTWFFVPGSNQRNIDKVATLEADAFIFDLEDAVAISEKQNARDKVIQAIARYQQKNIFVRVNSFDSPYFLEDVRQVVVQGVDGIVLPKAETPAQLQVLDKLLLEKEQELNIPLGSIKIVALIESALGIHHAVELANFYRVTRLAFGAIDYTLDIGATLTEHGSELLFAKSQLVLASRVAKIEGPIDVVYVDIYNEEGLRKEVTFSKELGFKGKLIVHPAQLKVVNEVYTPTDSEVEQAKKIIQAAAEAEEQGKGVVSVDGKMIDLPVIKKAEGVLALYNRLSVTTVEN